MKRKQAVVFDLDKTIGFFTQIAVVMEAMEEVLPDVNKIILSPESQSVLILGGDETLKPVPFGPTP